MCEKKGDVQNWYFFIIKAKAVIISRQKLWSSIFCHKTASTLLLWYMNESECMGKIIKFLLFTIVDKWRLREHTWWCFKKEENGSWLLNICRVGNIKPECVKEKYIWYMTHCMLSEVFNWNTIAFPKCFDYTYYFYKFLLINIFKILLVSDIYLSTRHKTNRSEFDSRFKRL